jgi:hypothetical protein
MHSKNLRAYLDAAAGIAGLLPQAERLIELRHMYRRLVPQQLLRSSSIVNYRQQTVVIFAENSAIAAKLRLLTPRLINDFSKSGVEVTGIRLEVQPRQFPIVEAIAKRARLSRAGAESLDALARQLPACALRQALAAMAARGISAQQSDQPSPGDEAQALRRDPHKHG